MNYQERIQQNQKFLLKLLNLHIGNYFPLRKWLGIDYKGEIQEITHLSFAYNTKYFKKGKKWFKQVTRTYQQPDLGYKLNLVLDKIPQIALLPALLQPAYGLGALAFFFLTQTTYQPSTKDARILSNTPNTNYNETHITVSYYESSGQIGRDFIHFDISDIPDGAVFSQGDLALVYYEVYNDSALTVYISRMTQLAWVEDEVTWNSYSTGNAWDSAGGDFVSTNQATQNLTTVGTYTWSSANLIQDCYDNQSKNVHLCINPLVASVNTHKRAGSRTYTTEADRPKLTVTYTAPVDNAILFFCNF